MISGRLTSPPCLTVLLGQTANVGDQVFNLGVFQFAGVAWHLSFALRDGFLDLGICFGLHFWGCEISSSHLAALAIGAMAHRALGLVSCGCILCDSRRTADRDYPASQQSCQAQSEREMFHGASSLGRCSARYHGVRFRHWSALHSPQSTLCHLYRFRPVPENSLAVVGSHVSHSEPMAEVTRLCDTDHASYRRNLSHPGLRLRTAPMSLKT